ncbi:Homeobox protein DBX1, partial [Caligus rogercresseyi]
KGLEKRFQIQKYISKPDRKKLAEKLGLKDSQVRICIYFFKSFDSPLDGKKWNRWS